MEELKLPDAPAGLSSPVSVVQPEEGLGRGHR